MTDQEDPIDIEASQWMTRLEAPVDEGTLNELQRWCAQSPRHLTTFVDYLALDLMLHTKGAA